MILLDTNVLSALMQSEPVEEVVAWLDGLPPESIWTTSITVFEVRMGLELLAAGRRRKRLEGAFDSMIEEDLEGRVAVFDRSSAEAAARVAAERRQAGRPVDFRDVEIAGIALARKASLATRNVKHFEGLGLELLDPWSGA